MVRSSEREGGRGRGRGRATGPTASRWGRGSTRWPSLAGVHCVAGGVARQVREVGVGQHEDQLRPRRDAVPVPPARRAVLLGAAVRQRLLDQSEVSTWQHVSTNHSSPGTASS